MDVFVVIGHIIWGETEAQEASLVHSSSLLLVAVPADIRTEAGCERDASPLVSLVPNNKFCIIPVSPTRSRGVADVNVSLKAKNQQKKMCRFMKETELCSQKGADLLNCVSYSFSFNPPLFASRIARRCTSSSKCESSSVKFQVNARSNA